MRSKLLDEGYNCDIKVFGSSVHDSIIEKKCKDTDGVEFIETPNGETNKQIAMKMSRILKYFWDNEKYSHGVWMDSNNWFSEKSLNDMVQCVLGDVPYWGHNKYTMYSVEKSAFRKFVFRGSGHSIIGPGKGWTREAFVDSYKDLYEKTKLFVSKSCLKRMSNDADLNYFFKKKYEPKYLGESHEDCIDVKLFGDINGFDGYRNNAFPIVDVSEGFLKAMLPRLMVDHGPGLKLPVKFRDKVSALLG